MSVHRVLGTYPGENEILAAVRSAREAGFAVHDVYTPYPVHGMDEAMGLPRSRLSVVCFLCGLAGGSLALAFMSWCSTVSWPANVGGKSFLALPALVPVTFEVIVLTAALGTVLALFARCGLWPGKAPDLPDARVTDDRYVLALAVDPGSAARAREHLEGTGAAAVTERGEP